MNKCYPFISLGPTLRHRSQKVDSIGFISIGHMMHGASYVQLCKLKVHHAPLIYIRKC